MRAVLLVALVACGGGSSSVPPKEPQPQPQYRTRIPIEEPEEDTGSADGVELQSTRGHMEVAVIEAGIGPHKTELSDCFTTRVKRRGWLGGRVALHWEINKAGEITSVKLAESDLGAWPVEKCLLETARAASFGKPVGGDADFSIPLDFTAKGRMLTWDEDQALRAIGGQVATLDECAVPENAGKKKRKKPGAKRVTVPDDVVVTLYVGPGGKAQSVGFASAKSSIDDAWADCAEKIVMGWRLTDPRGVIAKAAIRYRAN